MNSCGIGSLHGKPLLEAAVQKVVAMLELAESNHRRWQTEWGER